VNAIKIVLFVVSISVFSKTFLAERSGVSGSSRDTSDESSSEEGIFSEGSWQDFLNQLLDKKNWDLSNNKVNDQWMDRAISCALQEITNKAKNETILAGELYYQLEMVFDQIFGDQRVQIKTSKRDIIIDTIVRLFKETLQDKITKRQKLETKKFRLLLSRVVSGWMGNLDQIWKNDVIEQAIKLFKLNTKEEDIVSPIETAINDYNGKLTWLQRLYKIVEDTKNEFINNIKRQIQQILLLQQDLNKELQEKIKQGQFKEVATIDKGPIKQIAKQQIGGQHLIQKEEDWVKIQELLKKEDEERLKKEKESEGELPKLQKLVELQQEQNQEIARKRAVRLDTWKSVLNELENSNSWSRFMDAPEKEWKQKAIQAASDVIEYKDKDGEQVEEELKEAFKKHYKADPLFMDRAEGQARFQRYNLFKDIEVELEGRKQTKAPMVLLKKEKEKEIVNRFINKPSTNSWKENLSVLSRSSSFWDLETDMPMDTWIEMAVNTAINALSNDQATKDMLINDLEEKLKRIYGVPTLEITVPVLLETYVYRVPELEKKKIVTIKTSFEQQLDHKMLVALKVKLLKRQNDIKSLIEKELLKEKQQQQEKEQEQKDWALIQKERKQRYVKQQALDPDYQKSIDEQKERGKKLGEEELQTISIIKKDLEHKQQIEKEKLEEAKKRKETQKKSIKWLLEENKKQRQQQSLPSLLQQHVQEQYKNLLTRE